MEDVPTVTKASGISNQGGTFYSSSEVAAKAYARRYFNHTRKDGIEYGAIIYSKTYGGKTVYWLGSLQVGDATTIEPNFAADQSLLNIGWDIAGFIHAHPNGISFSKDDDRDAHLSAVAQYSRDDIYSFVSYVVFLHQRKYLLIHGMAIWENEGLMIYPVGSDYLYPDLSRQGQHGTIAITYYRLY